ncbi:MAG: hypothetical protein JEY97_04030 [Bacteroidales bacterium]|nr:hypothetical protein [Bacteroidales bacterium]
MKKLILLLIVVFLYTQTAQTQITRGATPGEIYISNDWYIENGIIHKAVFRSDDNGETLTVQYEATDPPYGGAMGIGKVLGDATQGALYNFGDNELWVSFDYGVNWEYRESNPSYTKFFSGVNQGLIFKGNYGFFKSVNYGLSFELLPITVTCPFTEVGFYEPEFYGITGEAGSYYNFVHTIDYGQTYTEIPIDSSVAFWAPGGYWPKISRGTEPGELYLVSWWLNSSYKIFHSIDTGYTWTEKFESGYIDIYSWGVQYTAGRQQGSFYVKRSTYDFATQYSFIYIDYSSDYGETFTTYFHGAPSPQPSNYPENFSAHNIELKWTDPEEGILPHAYLVRMSRFGFEAIPVPVDNKSIPDCDTVKNIPYGEEKCIFKNLIPATVYYFKIFPYTLNGGEINYKTEGGGIQTMKMTKE